LHTYIDNVFSEVEDLVYSQFPELKRDPSKAGEIIQHIFGPVACDPDDGGLPFAIDASPPCKRCGSTNTKSRGFVDPPKIFEMNIPPVTHERWNRLTEQEKAEAVRMSVADLLK
jgi:hypothetical protein